MVESLISLGIGLGQQDKVFVEGLLVADGDMSHKICYSTDLTDKRRNGVVRDTREKRKRTIVTVQDKDQSSET